MLTTAYMHVAHWSSSTPCVLQASSDQNTLLLASRHACHCKISVVVFTARCLLQLQYVGVNSILHTLAIPIVP